MRKTIIIASIFGIMALTACTNEDAAVDHADDGVYHKSGNTINVNDQQAGIYNEGPKQSIQKKNDNFGYVRHTRNPVQGDNVTEDYYAAVDREQLANIISHQGTVVPNVDDVSTLVTGSDVLIVYSTDSKDRNLTADQMKKTAMSVVPQWYHIYVSDNTTLRKNVENFAKLETDTPDIKTSLSGLIQEMKKSPQGN